MGQPTTSRSPVSLGQYARGGVTSRLIATVAEPLCDLSWSTDLLDLCIARRSVLAGRLGCIQGSVSPGHEIHGSKWGVARVPGGGSDRNGELPIGSLTNLDIAHIFDEPVGHCHGTLTVDTGEHDGEFSAAEPGEHVARSYHLTLQGPTDGAQCVVADEVAIGVVELFEAVHVDHRYGDRDGTPGAAPDLWLQYSSMPLRPSREVFRLPSSSNATKSSRLMSETGLTAIDDPSHTFLVSSAGRPAIHRRRARVTRKGLSDSLRT